MNLPVNSGIITRIAQIKAWLDANRDASPRYALAVLAPEIDRLVIKTRELTEHEKRPLTECIAVMARLKSLLVSSVPKA
jgi:hypothetical protein